MMKNRHAVIPTLLLAGALPFAAAAASEEDGPFVTENGNTVAVDREVIEGANGGRAVRRDVTVTDPDGELLGEGRNVRFRTADGDVGRANGRRWTDEDGNVHTRTRAGRVSEDGDVSGRTARTVRDENGEVTRRAVNRGRRDADGGGVAVQRRAGRGENGAAAGRRVVRGDGQGNRTVRTQRVRRSAG